MKEAHLLVALALVGLVGVIQPHGARCPACNVASVTSAGK